MSKKVVLENRFENWKGDSRLTFVDRSDGRHRVERGGRSYDYGRLAESLKTDWRGMRSVSAEQVEKALDWADRERSGRVDEVRYDWSHIDPRTGLPKVKEDRPEDKIRPMSVLPDRSGWVWLLQNRVNLRSVGNSRDAKAVWYDRRDRSASSDRGKSDSVFFRAARLGKDGLGQGQPAAGWIRAEDWTERQIPNNR